MEASAIPPVSSKADASSDVTEIAPLEQPKGCAYDQVGTGHGRYLEDGLPGILSG